MKKAISFAGIFISASTVSSALAELMYEPFDYTTGANLTTASAFGLTNPLTGVQWAGAGNGTDNITVGTVNLNGSGMDVGPGLSATWTANGNASRLGIGPFGTPGGVGGVPS